MQFSRLFKEGPCSKPTWMEETRHSAGLRGMDSSGNRDPSRPSRGFRVRKLSDRNSLPFPPMADGCQVPPLLWTPPLLRRMGPSSCVHHQCWSPSGCPRATTNQGQPHIRMATLLPWIVPASPLNLSLPWEHSRQHQESSLSSPHCQCPLLCTNYGLFGSRGLHSSVWALHLTFVPYKNNR